MGDPLDFWMLREANVNRQTKWEGADEIKLEFLAMALAGEVGEACNVAKKLVRKRDGIAGSRASVEDLAEELADVIIYADLIAMKMGIDLAVAVRSKFNKSSEKLGLGTFL